MMKLPGVAVGAGLASALLFVVSAKGTAAATLIAYFTALPVIIAAIGFGHLSGLAGAAIGSLAVTFALGPILGAFFALAFALPGWWLSYLALLARPDVATSPAAAGSPAAGGGAPQPLIWYPVGRIVTWAAALSSAAVLALGAAMLIRFGGYDQAMDAVSHRLESSLGYATTQTGLRSSELADAVVRVLPLAMAASSFLMLIVNLWLGGRISKVSERLPRPWPSIPDGLRLPRAAAAVFVIGLIPAVLADGALATEAGTVAASLGMAFVLQGLAAAHVLTHGFRSRRAILLMIYLVTFLAMPWPLVALALLGVVDCLFSLRHRTPPTSTPTNPTGGTPWK